MPKPTDTLVFLGPSLSLDQARTLLPQACFLPPLRCGDLLQALRLMPKIILIIDGHFEHCAAVWHKEILFALQQGIQVYGASSMGALRAAELQRFGMQGIGKIFNAYSSGELNDDDEVAVAHLSAQQHYQCLSEAMVDIRATIDSACKQEILSITTANLITDAAKKLFYPERTLTKACQFLLREKNSAPQIENFLTWLAQDQFVSQKALDAKLALETINKITLQAKTIKTSPVICQPSRYFVTLSRMMACQAFFCWQDNLPETEKIILAARLLDEDYLFAKRLARCLAIVYFMPGNTETLLPTDQPLAYEFHEYDHNWQQKNNLSPTEFKNFIERLQHIDKKIRGTFTQIKYKFMHDEDSNSLAQQFHLRALMILSGDYIKFKSTSANLTHQEGIQFSVIKHFQKDQPGRYRGLYLTAMLLKYIDNTSRQQGLELKGDALQQQCMNFRLQHGLMADEAFFYWLDENDLTVLDFQSLVAIAFRFDYLVRNNNVDSLLALGQINCPQHFWLLDAIYLLDLFPQAKQIITDTKFAAKCLTEFCIKLEQHGDTYAHRHDFYAGVDDFNRFAASLKAYDTNALTKALSAKTTDLPATS